MCCSLVPALRQAAHMHDRLMHLPATTVCQAVCCWCKACCAAACRDSLGCCLCLVQYSMGMALPAAASLPIAQAVHAGGVQANPSAGPALSWAPELLRTLAAFESLSPDSPTEMFRMSLATLISRMGCPAFLSFYRQQQVISAKAVRRQAAHAVSMSVWAMQADQAMSQASRIAQTSSIPSRQPLTTMAPGSAQKRLSSLPEGVWSLEEQPARFSYRT